MQLLNDSREQKQNARVWTDKWTDGRPNNTRDAPPNDDPDIKNSLIYSDETWPRTCANTSRRQVQQYATTDGYSVWS